MTDNGFSPRLDRQLRYLNEDVQREIEKNEVVIVGGESDAILKDVLIQHLMIGTKKITIITDGQVDFGEHWFGMKLEPGPRAHSLKKVIDEHFNEGGLKTKALAVHTEDKSTIKYLNKADVIFECSNNPYSKGVALKNKKQSSVHSISGINHSTGYRLVKEGFSDENIVDEATFEIFMGQPQSSITSMVSAGFAMQNYILDLKYDGKETFLDTFWYRLDVERPFVKPKEDEIVVFNPEDIAKFIVMNIGNGAVGTAGQEMQARMGVKNGYAWDDDRIEDINRHAQPHYLFMDGDFQLDTSHKADVCCTRINRSHRANFMPVIERFTHKSEIPNDVSVIFSYVDRIYPRAVIDTICYENDIPQIYASTAADAGSVAVSVPTDAHGDPFPNMDTYFNLDDQCKAELAAEYEYMRTAGACGRQVFSSLVPVNFMLGAMSAHILPFALMPEKYGYPFRQVRRYDKTAGRRCVISDFSDAESKKDPARLDNLSRIYTETMREFA